MTRVQRPQRSVIKTPRHETLDWVIRSATDFMLALAALTGSLSRVPSGGWWVLESEQLLAWHVPIGWADQVVKCSAKLLVAPRSDRVAPLSLNLGVDADGGFV